jgi:hypothetical protein
MVEMKSADIDDFIAKLKQPAKLARSQKTTRLAGRPRSAWARVDRHDGALRHAKARSAHGCRETARTGAQVSTKLTQRRRRTQMPRTMLTLTCWLMKI